MLDPWIIKLALEESSHATRISLSFAVPPSSSYSYHQPLAIKLLSGDCSGPLPCTLGHFLSFFADEFGHLLFLTICTSNMLNILSFQFNFLGFFLSPWCLFCARLCSPLPWSPTWDSLCHGTLLSQPKLVSSFQSWLFSGVLQTRALPWSAWRQVQLHLRDGRCYQGIGDCVRKRIDWWAAKNQPTIY